MLKVYPIIVAFNGIHFIVNPAEGRSFEPPLEVTYHGLTESMGIIRTQETRGFIAIKLSPPSYRRRILLAFRAAHHYHGGLQIKYFHGSLEKDAIRTVEVLPGASFVDCFDESVTFCQILFPENFSVSNFSVGISKAKETEYFLASHPKLRERLRQARKTYQLIKRGTTYIQRNGLTSASLEKAQLAIQQLNTGSSCLLDPAKAVFGYATTHPGTLSLKRAHIGISSRGNFFMREIAILIGDAFTELGLTVNYFDEFTPPEPSTSDIALVVAPHEFFVIDCPSSTFRKLRRHPRFAVLNTEQAQTQWFAKALKYLRSAKLVLDMSYQTATRLQFNKVPAFFLPLGYSPRYQARFTNHSLQRKGPLRGLPEHMLTEASEDYKQRPIDILFVGTESSRRKAFLSRHAEIFSSYRCFIYIPSGNDPFQAGSDASIEFDQLIGLSKRSKIILNIHRDDDRYLEWQRVVNIGIFSGAKVISETCETNPLLTPGLHYVDSPIEDLAQACVMALQDPEHSERFATRATSDLAKRVRLSTLLSKLPWQ